MQARSLLAGSFHTPETLNVVGSAYGDAWAEIAHRFNGDAEKARLRLAHAVLAVAEDNGQSSETLKNAALKLMALAYGDQPDSKRGLPYFPYEAPPVSNGSEPLLSKFAGRAAETARCSGRSSRARPRRDSFTRLSVRDSFRG